MKKLIIALIIPLPFGCSKDEEPNPSFTENLTGSKYRAEAWYNSDGYGQVYQVLDFKANNKVEFSLRLSNNSMVNEDYTVLSSYKVISDTQIEITHKGYTDVNAEVNKAIVTGDVLSISLGSLKGVYEKY